MVRKSTQTHVNDTTYVEQEQKPPPSADPYSTAEVQILLAVVVFDIRNLTFGHDAFSESTDTVGNVMFFELIQAIFRGRDSPRR